MSEFGTNICKLSFHFVEFEIGLSKSCAQLGSDVGKFGPYFTAYVGEFGAYFCELHSDFGAEVGKLKFHSTG